MPKRAALSPTWILTVLSKARIVFTSFGDSFTGRPLFRLRARAAVKPATVRSRIRLRSNSADHRACDVPHGRRLEPKANASARLTLPATNQRSKRLTSLHILDISKIGKDLAVLTYQCKYKKGIMIEEIGLPAPLHQIITIQISELRVGRVGAKPCCVAGLVLGRQPIPSAKRHRDNNNSYVVVSIA